MFEEKQDEIDHEEQPSEMLSLLEILE